MANTKSAQKAQRQAERRAARNRSARSEVRTYVKKATAAVAELVETSAEVVRAAVSKLDSAARKGIIHRNAAARRKSRLMARLHALTTSADAAPAAPATKESAKPAARTSRARASGTGTTRAKASGTGTARARVTTTTRTAKPKAEKK